MTSYIIIYNHIYTYTHTLPPHTHTYELIHWDGRHLNAVATS